MAFSITTLCRYAECRILFIVMLSVDTLCVIMLNVINLSVVAPYKSTSLFNKLAFKAFDIQDSLNLPLLYKTNPSLGSCLP